MGSISRSNALNRHIEAYGEGILETYRKKLIGKTVTDITDVYCDYWVQGTIWLDNGDSYEVHYRWTSELEDDLGYEVVEDGEMRFSEFVSTYFKDKTITSIDIGFERDDYLNVYAYADGNATGIALEIPVISINDVYELEEAANTEALKAEEKLKVFYVFQTHQYVRDVQLLNAPVSLTDEQLDEVMDALNYDDEVSLYSDTESRWADWSGEEDVLISRLVAPSLEAATSLAAERYNLNMIRIVEVIE